MYGEKQKDPVRYNVARTYWPYFIYNLRWIARLLSPRITDQVLSPLYCAPPQIIVRQAWEEKGQYLDQSELSLLERAAERRKLRRKWISEDLPHLKAALRDNPFLHGIREWFESWTQKVEDENSISAIQRSFPPSSIMEIERRLVAETDTFASDKRSIQSLWPSKIVLGRAGLARLRRRHSDDDYFQAVSKILIENTRNPGSVKAGDLRANHRLLEFLSAEESDLDPANAAVAIVNRAFSIFGVPGVSPAIGLDVIGVQQSHDASRNIQDIWKRYLPTRLRRAFL